MDIKPRGLITFDEAKERAEQRGDEYIFGAIDVDLGLIPHELRLRYAPEGTLQRNNLMDSMGCASRCYINALKAKFTYFYKNGMHPANKRWLEDNGYVINGNVVFDETFIEILSGTTQQGNSLKAPIDTIYRVGLIPECLPLENSMTWAQYMNPKRITQAHKDMGKEFLRRFGINYEQVKLAQFPEAMKEDILAVAGHGWPSPKNGIYPRTEATIQHAFALFNDAITSFDDDQPAIKTLSKNFKFFEWGYSVSITRETPNPNETIALFEVLRQNGLLAFFAEALNRFLDAAANTPPESVTEPLPVTPAPVPTPPPATDEKLIAALIQVESGGDDNAIGDKHLANKAYGCLQIRQPYITDANQYLGTNYKPQDCLGNRALSIKLFRAYMARYKLTTDEQKARSHNGGPSAARPGTKMYIATNGYWNKVRKLL